MATIPFLTSAPGKVIIFGEHSVVYNKPAIAAALSLRTYLLVSQNRDPESIALEFPDIDFRYSWKIADFPWELVSHVGNRPQPTEELVPEIVNELANNMLTDIPSSLHYAAAHCFLYLYIHLSKPTVKGLIFSIRSTLPIGAGLGSSASISVCLSSALSYIGGHVTQPTLALNDASHGRENPDCSFIDSWSFMGEKCIHGTPSGIDNACASHGGAVMFQRNSNTSLPNVRTSMRNFPPLDLLLTNTRIPRRTAELVGNISRLNQEYPSVTGSILHSIENLTKEAYSIMLKPLDIESKNRLKDLIRMNQGLLVALGVSHPALDRIKFLTDEAKVGETKLTGAGGGGCAITLLNDELDKSKLATLVQNFEDAGYETFETKLGGKGCGLLIPQGDELQYCNTEVFINFTRRSEIEDAIGCDSVSGWSFW